jgi:hypothetical protein
MSWLTYVVPAAIGLLLVAATLLRRDLWPFSHYPMFAGYEAPRTLRFFRLQFTRPNGNTTALVTLEPDLGDAFDREFSRAWPDATEGAASREIVLRFWANAVRRRPALRDATQAQVMLRMAQLGTVSGVEIAETPVHVVDLSNAV